MKLIPLTKTNRVAIARAFAHYKHYDVVLDAVVEGQMGKAYTNDFENSELYRVEVEPFQYLSGDVAHEDAVEMVRAIKPKSFVLPCGEAWMSLIQAEYGERALFLERSLYDSRTLDRKKIGDRIDQLTPIGKIKRLDARSGQKVYEDTTSMIFIQHFDSGTDFFNRGLGFVMEVEGKIVGAAYSSMISGSKAQIALYVANAFRKRGIATALALHFVAYCLDNHIDPVWVANNPETCKLAEQLGFERDETFQILYITEE